MRLSVEQDESIKQEADLCIGTQGESRLSGVKVKGQCGFTLVELIMVLVIVGILAVAAIPRMFDKTSFESRGFYDRTISTLRYAQKLAIAQRRFVCVGIAGNVITLTYDTTPPSTSHTAAACGSDLTSPEGVTPYKIAPPSEVTVTPSSPTFSFDALGSTATTQTITVSGYGAVTVEAGTGYVH
jgi:MSHA pilin protein MshC